MYDIRLLRLTLNQSKLHDYYTERRTSSRPLYAMFHISGEVPAKDSALSITNGVKEDDENAMAIDEEMSGEEDIEDLTCSKCVVVDESSLEGIWCLQTACLDLR